MHAHPCSVPPHGDEPIIIVLSDRVSCTICVRILRIGAMRNTIGELGEYLADDSAACQVAYNTKL